MTGWSTSTTIEYEDPQEDNSPTGLHFEGKKKVENKTFTLTPS